ncbi:hypothetical protein U1Q18_049035, partial [Sarracenia purpurea var. burkii]
LQASTLTVTSLADLSLVEAASLGVPILSPTLPSQQQHTTMAASTSAQSPEPAAANSSEQQVQEDVSHVELEKDPPLDKDGVIVVAESSPSERRLVPPVSQTFERKKRLPKNIHIDAS